MRVIRRPLNGMIVNLSISESIESADRGFPTAQVNRAMLKVVSALFGQGSGLIFGHDWREDGIMEAVHGFAQQVQPPVSYFKGEFQESGRPLLWNLLPWPDTPLLSQSDLKCLAFSLHVEQAGLPDNLIQYEKEALNQGRESALYQYLRARGLTHLRRRLTEISQARLCVGGRKKGSKGRYPGVIEEALFSLEYHKPLYLVGVLGGAAQQLIHALMHKPIPDDFCLETEIHHHYSNPPIGVTESETKIDGLESREAVWKRFCAYGIDGLAKDNGLTVEENVRLFQTTALDDAIQAVLIGLSQVQSATLPKEVPMTDIVDKLNTPEECDRLIENIYKKDPEIALRARRKAIELRAAKHNVKCDAEREALQAVYAYEAVLSKKHGRRTRASRTWQMIERHGIIGAVERAVNRPQETIGYTALIEMGMPDLAFEAVILRYPHLFTPKAIERSKLRMAAWKKK